MTLGSVLDRHACELLNHSVKHTGSRSSVISLYDRRGAVPRTYHLHGYHLDGDGPLREAIADYDARALPQDPFLSPDVLQRCAGGSGCIMLDTTDPDIQHNDYASEYWAFLSRCDADIAGAVIKQSSAVSIGMFLPSRPITTASSTS